MGGNVTKPFFVPAITEEKECQNGKDKEQSCHKEQLLEGQARFFFQEKTPLYLIDC